MSDDKLFSQLAKTIDNEDNFNKNLPEIVQAIAKNKKNYITGVSKITFEALASTDIEVKRRFLALQLLKECIDLKYPAFAATVAESDILPLLERNSLSFPDKESDIKARFGNIEYAKRYYLLTVECIKNWGETFEQEREPLSRYPTLYKKLLNKGLKFPTSYLFFKNKELAKGDSKMNVKPLQGLSSPNTNSSKDLKSGDKKKQEARELELIEALRGGYEEILQQPFFYNAQGIELDDEEGLEDYPPTLPQQQQQQYQQPPAPQIQAQSQQAQSQKQQQQQQQQQQPPPPMDLPMPFMYNAQELELDDEFDDAIEEVDRSLESSLKNSAVTVQKDQRQEAQIKNQAPLARVESDPREHLDDSYDNEFEVIDTKPQPPMTKVSEPVKKTGVVPPIVEQKPKVEEIPRKTNVPPIVEQSQQVSKPRVIEEMPKEVVPDKRSVYAKVQGHRAGNVEDDFDSEEERRQAASRKANQASMKSFDEDRPKKRDNSLLHVSRDENSFRKTQRDELAEIAARIGSKDGKSYSELMLDASVDNTMLREGRKEMVDLRKRNEKLLEENQRLRERNEELEAKLARENKRLRDLGEQLEIKEGEIRAARYHAEKMQEERVHAVAAAENHHHHHLEPHRPAEEKPRTPLGSPKAEQFNKRPSKTPKGDKSGRSHANFFHPPLPGAETKKSEMRSVASIGQFLRKKLEGNDDLFGTSTEQPSHYLVKSIPNIMLKTEYTSPKQNNDTVASKFLTASLDMTKPFPAADHKISAENLDNFQLACIKDHALLFENDHLIVESKTNLDNRTGILEVGITYTNKTAKTIEELAVAYKAVPNLILKAQNTNLGPRIGPNAHQTHYLTAQLSGNVERVGSMIIAYTIQGEPFQLDLNFPVTMTKFVNLLPISSATYTKKRKEMTSRFPDNVEESSKIRLNQKHLDDLSNHLFSKMALIQSENTRPERFAVYGGYIRPDSLGSELLVRFIVENETYLTIIQINYEDGFKRFAKDLLKSLVFICNEKVVIS